MIGKLLGHRQVQMTARYAHLAQDSVKVSAARVAESFEADMYTGREGRPGRHDCRRSGRCETHEGLIAQ